MPFTQVMWKLSPTWFWTYPSCPDWITARTGLLGSLASACTTHGRLPGGWAGGGVCSPPPVEPPPVEPLPVESAGATVTGETDVGSVALQPDVGTVRAEAG